MVCVPAPAAGWVAQQYLLLLHTAVCWQRVIDTLLSLGEYCVCLCVVQWLHVRADPVLQALMCVVLPHLQGGRLSRLEERRGC
jgi:hypothetical protein